VRAELKRICSPDVSSLETWSPAEDQFGIFLEVYIGPADQVGEEQFGMLLCTSEWFANNRVGERPVSGLHTLFVRSYNYPDLKSCLERAVRRCDSDSWIELVKKLAWLGHHEFEACDWVDQ
jgi:hypothetical protein